MHQPCELLQTLMQKALAAVKPELLVAPHLAINTKQAITVIGFGKAAAHMALGVETALGRTAQGMVIVPDGYEAACQWIKVLSASHPIPDGRSVHATSKLMAQIEQSNNQILALVSGGGSSVLCRPAAFLSLQQKQHIIRKCLSYGIAIGDFNVVRAALSLVKSGGLAKHAHGAKVRVLVLSDVAGDDLSCVASGPFSPKGPDGRQALQIIEKAKICIPIKVRQGLLDLPKPKSRVQHKNVEQILIGNAKTALHAAENWAKSHGIRVRILSDQYEASAQDLAYIHHQQIVIAKRDGIQLLLSGGEANVQVKGSGQGGPNRHFLLSLALLAPQVTALAVDTDGKDGSDDQAGAWISPKMLARALAMGLDPQQSLLACDSGGFFKAIGTSIDTGCTGTNVNDFRAIWLG